MWVLQALRVMSPGLDHTPDVGTLGMLNATAPLPWRAMSEPAVTIPAMIHAQHTLNVSLNKYRVSRTQSWCLCSIPRHRAAAQPRQQGRPRAARASCEESAKRNPPVPDADRTMLLAEYEAGPLESVDRRDTAGPSA